MIRTKSELLFYIKADRMMNRGYFNKPFRDKMKSLFVSDPIMHYLESMRNYSYYKQVNSISGMIFRLLWGVRFRRLGYKLGFSIAEDVLGYGCVIPHYGTIVIGSPNTIGNYCVLHTSTCVTANGKTIGDGLYLSTGVKITSKIILGDYVSIGANSVVNKSFVENYIMIAGAPAVYKKQAGPWFGTSGIMYERVLAVEALKMRFQTESV